MTRHKHAAALAAWASLSLAAPLFGRELFDCGWRFQLGDPPGAERVAFDAVSWRPVDLPHDFCIEGPYDEKVKNGKMNGFRPLGVGWYRKAFVTLAEQRADAGRVPARIRRPGPDHCAQPARIW